jgi:hypothetical protein
MSGEKASKNESAGDSGEGPAEGTVVTPNPRFPGFDSVIRWLGERAAYIAAACVVVAIALLWYLDTWILSTHGSQALGEAVTDQAEIWIAAAATIGLWATARHVKGLASAIRYRTLAESSNSPPPSEEASVVSAPPDAIDPRMDHPRPEDKP